MKGKLLRKVLYIVLVLGIFTCFSCAQPSPLTGTWVDPKGSQITLLPDNTYSAKIVNKFKEIHQYKGSYNVLLNAISFTSDDGYQMVSEWDVRGSMLYLRWPSSDDEPMTLTLYKTKN